MVAIVRLNPLMSLLLGERSAPFDGASLPLVYAGTPGILLRAERRRWRRWEGAHIDAWTGGRAVVEMSDWPGSRPKPASGRSP